MEIKISKLIIKKDNIKIIADRVQEVHKNMIIKEKIIIATKIKDKKDLKDNTTCIILKKWNQEMVPRKIIKKVGFKTTDLAAHMVIKMIKKKDSNIEEVKCQTENMEIFTCKKMKDALIVKKKGTSLENAKSHQMETIET